LNIKTILPAIIIACFSYASYASGSACPQHYAGATPPQLINPKLAQGFEELCAPHGGFATGYSKLVRSPLYSAEYLTADNLRERQGKMRIDSFRPDDRLARRDRAELSDFKNSGYDRGHLVPAANSNNDATEADTFVLSNMIAQAPRNNRGMHAHIEDAVRRFTKKVGAVYVITGPIFEGDQFRLLNGRVGVPTSIFKVVYLPSRNEAAAYLEVNSDGPDGQEYREVSMAQLSQITGIEFLPGVKHVGLLRLPKPTKKGVIGE
jgi:endonuclease G